jgi:hypothetical protein
MVIGQSSLHSKKQSNPRHKGPDLTNHKGPDPGGFGFTKLLLKVGEMFFSFFLPGSAQMVIIEDADQILPICVLHLEGTKSVRL